MNSAVSTVRSGSNSIKTIFNSIDLKSSGSNMIQGLIDGIESKKTKLLNTIRALATAVNSEYERIQDINSPSKIWQSYGAYQVEGLNLGVAETIPEAEKTADDLANVYTPERDSAITQNRNTVTEYNSYNPEFNLTISGTNDDRTMERKVKRWIKEALSLIHI